MSEIYLVVSGKSAVADKKIISTAVSVWGNHSTRISYEYRLLSSVDQTQTGVYWLVGDINGVYSVVASEKKDFSYTNLESTTQKILAKYGPGDKKGTDSTGQNTGKSGTNLPTKKETDPNGSGGRTGNFGLPIGLEGLFNIEIPFGLPNWLWLIGTAFAAMKFVDTSNKLGKVIYGGLGAFCTINYLNNQKIPIKLPKIPFIKQV